MLIKMDSIKIKKYRITLIVTGFLVIIICIAVAIYAKKEENNSAGLPNTRLEYRYVLREYNEQIGVFRANSNTPLRVLDVYTMNLPVVDQYELKEGIYIQDDEKLRIIIEDYSS